MKRLLMVVAGSFGWLLLASCTGQTSSTRPTTTLPTDPALAVPATVPTRCDSGVGACSLQIPQALQQRAVQLPSVPADGSCPTSTGAELDAPGVNGIAVGSGQVRVVLSQSGDLIHGQVDLAQSDVPDWLGIKTDWLINPDYSGWVIVRAKRLDGTGPIAALGEAGIGPVVIPPGPTANTFDGWRQQPSGTYVKAPGCYGFQIDGSSFQEQIIVKALAPSAG